MAEEDPTLIYDFTVATVIGVNIFGYWYVRYCWIHNTL